MKRTRPIPATVAVLSILTPAGCVPALGQAGEGSNEWMDRLRSLDEELPGWMAEAVVPGLSIAVVSADSAWIRAYGVSHAAEGRPVDAETIFEAASLSKPLFARMVRMEVERGTIDLDTPLSEYWHYSDLRESPWNERITARMVLSHRSGLPNWRRDRPLAIEFAPGERFQYSGEGYVYLEKALEHLRGRDLEDRAQRTVVGPFEMVRTSFVFEPGVSNHATPHDASGAPLEKRPAAPPGNPAASLHTTARDFSRFAQELLAEIRADTSVLTAITDRPTPVAADVAWGLGWGLEYPGARDTPALWHWGDNGPFKAFVYLDPVEGRGFVFFANGMNGLALTRRILEKLFPGPHPLLAWLRYDQLD